MSHNPLDGSENPPPQGPADPNVITRDIESALERGVMAWVEKVAKAGVFVGTPADGEIVHGKRQAAQWVVLQLVALSRGFVVIGRPRLPEDLTSVDPPVPGDEQ